MRSISVDDFYERSGEILVDLNEKEIPYVVTTGDEPAALLCPIGKKSPQAAVDQKPKADARGWEKYHHLAQDLRATWPEGRDSRALLNDIRR